jgi:ABC-type sugar transport system permease subunit
MAADIATTARVGGARRRKRAVRLSTGDRIAMAVMVGIPVLLTGALIWFPTISSIGLSFTDWDGIGGLDTIEWTGTTNYQQIATIYPPFWPAFRHNLYWLAALAFVGTPLGMFLAYQLDKQIRGSRFYQSIFHIPVVIAPAIIGLISELILSPQQGLVSSLFADPRHGHVIDWLGNPSRSLWAVLVLACWRHASYVMIIYLAGLKALDPTLREAAAIDGARGARTYFRVVLPALKPINIVLVVITVIEALRAFDIVYIINRGRNGLELLSVLITANIIGEASRIGYGSAIAVVLLTISLVPIVIFVWNSFQEVPES